MYWIRQLRSPGRAGVPPIAAAALLFLAMPPPASLAAGAADRAAEERKTVSCLDPAAVAQAPLLAQRVTVEFEGLTVAQAVTRLQADHGIPASFIDAPRAVEVGGRFELAPLSEVIAFLLAEASRYRCEIVSGRVVIFPTEEKYLEIVRGVAIRDEYRAVATRRYLDGLENEGLRDIAFLAGGLLESEALSEKVSLSPEAPFLEHLVELLGSDAKRFFVIQDSATGVRYLNWGRVP